MPEVSAVQIDKALTNVAVGYPMGTFISPRLLAPIPVGFQTGKYYVFDSAREFIRQADDKHRPGTASNQIDFDVTSSSYVCDGHALSAAVPDEEKANAEAIIRPYINKTNLITSKVMVNQEMGLKVKLDAALVSTLTSDPTNEWDDKVSGDPFADINLAVNAVEDATGMTPNIMAMDVKVMRALREHPDIIERVVYGGQNENPAMISVSGIAALFGFEEILISNAMYNSAITGQTASISRVWGSDVYIAYRSPTPAIDMPSLGYRFEWSPFTGSQYGFAVRKWYSDDRACDMVEVKKYYDQEITLAAAGYRLQNRLT